MPSWHRHITESPTARNPPPQHTHAHARPASPAFCSTSAAMGTVLLTGLEMMATQAAGQCCAMPCARPRTMPALMLNRSSRVMPGLRGTPAGGQQDGRRVQQASTVSGRQQASVASRCGHVGWGVKCKGRMSRRSCITPGLGVSGPRLQHAGSAQLRRTTQLPAHPSPRSPQLLPSPRLCSQRLTRGYDDQCRAGQRRPQLVRPQVAAHPGGGGHVAHVGGHTCRRRKGGGNGGGKRRSEEGWGKVSRRATAENHPSPEQPTHTHAHPTPTHPPGVFATSYSARSDT